MMIRSVMFLSCLEAAPALVGRWHVKESRLVRQLITNMVQTWTQHTDKLRDGRRLRRWILNWSLSTIYHLSQQERWFFDFVLKWSIGNVNAKKKFIVTCPEQSFFAQYLDQKRWRKVLNSHFCWERVDIQHFCYCHVKIKDMKVTFFCRIFTWRIMDWTFHEESVFQTWITLEWSRLEVFTSTFHCVIHFMLLSDFAIPMKGKVDEVDSDVLGRLVLNVSVC